MISYLFTFGFKNAAKILNVDLESEPFVSVYASNYEKAIKKILKLRLPHVETEDDLQFNSCQEEVDDSDEEVIKQS